MKEIPEKFPTGEPVSRPEIVEALKRLHTLSDAYLSALPLDVFRRPQGEKWSPADHVRHLSKTTHPIVQALAAPRALLFVRFGIQFRPSRPFARVREVYRERLAMGATAGRFAPTPQPPPSDVSAWRQRVMTSWRNAANALHAGIQRWPEKSLDRFRLPHPVLGRLSVREMLFFTLYHNSHHLNILANRVDGSGENPSVAGSESSP